MRPSDRNAFAMRFCISAVGALFLALFVSIYIILVPRDFSDKTFVFHVPEKASVHDIAVTLKEDGLVRSVELFKAHVRFLGKETELRAGHFLLRYSMNQSELLHALTTQSGSHQLVKVTIPEGFSILQIAEKLEEHGFCKREEFEQYAHKEAKRVFEKQFPFLSDIPLLTLEGYLFPETYFFRPNEPIRNIVRLMLQQFDYQVYRVYQEQEQSFKLSFHELATMASLVEKESANYDEMPLISSVFYNRLKKRMRLETDPTVVYALGLAHKDRVLYKDLEIQSPYNTYRRRGLPPTPIASFGRKAFQAALFPAKTEYLFFVVSEPGRHHFSKTYSEHLSVQRRRRR